jgi:hypothetical protein
MIVRAIERGVSEDKLAKALNMDVKAIRRRRTMLSTEFGDLKAGLLGVDRSGFRLAKPVSVPEGTDGRCVRDDGCRIRRRPEGRRADVVSALVGWAAPRQRGR